MNLTHLLNLNYRNDEESTQYEKSNLLKSNLIKNLSGISIDDENSNLNLNLNMNRKGSNPAMKKNNTKKNIFDKQVKDQGEMDEDVEGESGGERAKQENMNKEITKNIQYNNINININNNFNNGDKDRDI